MPHFKMMIDIKRVSGQTLPESVVEEKVFGVHRQNWGKVQGVSGKKSHSENPQTTETGYSTASTNRSEASNEVFILNISDNVSLSLVVSRR